MKVKIGLIGEMEPEFKELRRDGDYLISTLEVPGPLPWDIKMALDYGDVIKIAKLAFKLSILLFLLSGIRSRKNPKLPADF